MSDTTKKWLYLAIALLVVIKFGVQPLLEWQGEKLTEINQQRERLAKTNELLQIQETMAKAAERAQQEWEKAEQTFPAPASVNDFKRILQAEIGALGSKHSVQLDLVNWGRIRPLDINQLYEQPVSVTVSGSVTDVAKFHTALLRQYRYLRQQSARLDFRGRMIKSKVGTLNMELSAYFWFEEAIEP